MFLEIQDILVSQCVKSSYTIKDVGFCGSGFCFLSRFFLSVFLLFVCLFVFVKIWKM